MQIWCNRDLLCKVYIGCGFYLPKQRYAHENMQKFEGDKMKQGIWLEISLRNISPL